MEKMFNRAKFRNYYIPIFLIFFWFGASLLFNSAISFTVLVYPHPSSRIESTSGQKLLKGENISGEFKASNDHLGLIILKLKDYVTYSDIGEDVLLFRIKEKGSRNWYFSSTYRAGILDRNLVFPIGIPLIDSSKNKTYEFDFESLSGTAGNAIDVSKIDKSFHTGYKFSKEEIFGSKKAFLEFISNKIIFSFSNIEFLLTSLLYLTPLILYVLILFIGKRNVGRVILLCIVFLFCFDTFLLKQFLPGLTLPIIFGWVIVNYKLKFGSRITIAICASLILIWLAFTWFDLHNFDIKINFWVFTLLIVILIQLITEESRLSSSTLHDKRLK